ncbi:hypothetical protein C8F04DRAFT_1404948 [Mycena alexandri]|uniref:Uncharacterized protein n=1 Tax=Mycena alexandri TaxID=1745969 RepID=A0AAD6WMY1_9AGAR|nr:hypothetical protein C8F04DRAFT_1404948 [Mycena alexandri]
MSSWHTPAPVHRSERRPESMQSPMYPARPQREHETRRETSRTSTPAAAATISSTLCRLLTSTRSPSRARLALHPSKDLHPTHVLPVPGRPEPQPPQHNASSSRAPAPRLDSTRGPCALAHTPDARAACIHPTSNQHHPRHHTRPPLITTHHRTPRLSADSRSRHNISTSVSKDTRALHAPRRPVQHTPSPAGAAPAADPSKNARAIKPVKSTSYTSPPPVPGTQTRGSRRKQTRRAAPRTHTPRRTHDTTRAAPASHLARSTSGERPYTPHTPATHLHHASHKKLVPSAELRTLRSVLHAALPVRARRPLSSPSPPSSSLKHTANDAHVPNTQHLPATPGANGGTSRCLKLDAENTKICKQNHECCAWNKSRQATRAATGPPRASRGAAYPARDRVLLGRETWGLARMPVPSHARRAVRGTVYHPPLPTFALRPHTLRASSCIQQSAALVCSSVPVAATPELGYGGAIPDAPPCTRCTLFVRRNGLRSPSTLREEAAAEACARACDT